MLAYQYLILTGSTHGFGGFGDSVTSLTSRLYSLGSLQNWVTLVYSRDQEQLYSYIERVISWDLVRWLVECILFG